MATQASIPADWNMFVAMIPGMFLGMAIPMILAPLVFGRYFGAMEVMVPCMLGGMLAGMWVSMMNMSLWQAVVTSWQIGVATLFFCYVLDAIEKWRFSPSE